MPFAESGRFAGTSYAAAKWLLVGQSQGRGRLAPSGRSGKSIKDIRLYPLDQRFHAILTDGLLRTTQRQMDRGITDNSARAGSGGDRK